MQAGKLDPGDYSTYPDWLLRYLQKGLKRWAVEDERAGDIENYNHCKKKLRQIREELYARGQ